MTKQSDELPALLAAVAGAVGLQEGEAGVERVLRALHALAPASTKAVSRQIGLPLPLVAAVQNELRSRGLLSKDRPSRLTDSGLALIADLPPDLTAMAICDCCRGDGVRIPAELEPVVARLSQLIDEAPEIDLTLDQSFATAETKVRRVMLMLRYGLLPAHSMLAVGDDDLMSVAIAAVGDALGRRLVQRLAVVDVSAPVLDYILDSLTALEMPVELVQHDLRQPLPAQLRDSFDVAMTDPPYTLDGAALFLSRAVEALRPGPGRAVVFSFGPKGPEDTLEVQRAVTELGLNVAAMHRNFNEYLGAGIIGGVSHLQYLTTTAQTEPLVTGDHTGTLYTADQRTALREYVCNQCGTRYAVGRGGEWTTIVDLKRARCATCGSDRFRPLQLIRAG